MSEAASLTKQVVSRYFDSGHFLLHRIVYAQKNISNLPDSDPKPPVRGRQRLMSIEFRTPDGGSHTEPQPIKFLTPLLDLSQTFHPIK